MPCCLAAMVRLRKFFEQFCRRTFSASDISAGARSRAESSIESGSSCWSIHFSRPIWRTRSTSRRPRPVGQAVQGVEDGFVFGEFGDRKLALEFLVERDGGELTVLVLVCMCAWHDGEKQCEENSSHCAQKHDGGSGLRVTFFVTLTHRRERFGRHGYECETRSSGESCIRSFVPGIRAKHRPFATGAQ